MLEQSGAHRPLGGGTATGQRWKQLLGRFLAAASLLGNVQTLQKSLVMGSLKQNFIWPEILGKQNKKQPIKKTPQNQSSPGDAENPTSSSFTQG